MKALAALLIAAVALPGAAVASLATDCQLDFELFCPQVDPESPRADVVECLRENVDALTESCRAAVDPALVPRAAPPESALGSACGEDFRRLCGGEADRMAFARCVRRERANLSPACRDALDAAAPPRGPGASPGRP